MFLIIHAIIQSASHVCISTMRKILKIQFKSNFRMEEMVISVTVWLLVLEYFGN